MKKPRHEGEYPDREIDCQEALEASILAVIDEAEAAGWSVPETAAAIGQLADNIALQHASVDEVRRLLRKYRPPGKD